MPLSYANAKLPQYVTQIKNHKFTPDIIEIPQGQKFKLIVKNLDKTAEEFESHDLKREKIILGNSKAHFVLGPLKPGKYKFFGEFNEDSAIGHIIVKSKDDRVMHYNPNRPKSQKQALKMLEDGIDKVGVILKKKSVDEYDLEAIHEISYSLEYGVDFLIEKQTAQQKSIIKKLDQNIQGLHHASEKSELSNSRIWLTKTSLSFKKVKNILN